MARTLKQLWYGLLRGFIRNRPALSRLSLGYLFLGLIVPFIVQVEVQAKVLESHIKSRAELEYGLILYEFFQQDYFSALVESAYAEDQKNALAVSEQGAVLKGGMLLSYGVAEESKTLFQDLLDKTTKEPIRNRAWYFLAKFYYNKSEVANAAEALGRIQGEIPNELHFDYHYLATLVESRGSHIPGESRSFSKTMSEVEEYPYLTFNIAIGHLKAGDLASVVENLERVGSYNGSKEEFLVLADRAKHGLALLALEAGRFVEAWAYLTSIRTTGLYSNRALLAYAWAAIKVERFNDAVAALQLLNERSIAIPEVQEAKVLLAHLYEQEGSPRKALKANLLAIQDFKAGVEAVSEARKIIDKQDVPREFITNLEAIIDDSDWLSEQPSVDYKKLTPFLIDLMASNPFHETLKELADLYFLRENLNYWLIQADEHLLILDNASKKQFDKKSREKFEQSDVLRKRYQDKKSELRLMRLTLKQKDQERMSGLLKSTEDELAILNEKVSFFTSLKYPYAQPPEYTKIVKKLHRRIGQLLKRTKFDIFRLEPVMRGLVKKELDKHEERMNYYSAQSRLAKARLYDTTLSTLQDAQRAMKAKGPKGEGKEGRKENE